MKNSKNQSKKEIFKAIRKANLKEILLDENNINSSIYSEKIKTFKEALKKAGGKSFEIQKEQIAKKISKLFGNDKKIISYIDDIKDNIIEKKDIEKAYDLKDIDVAVVQGDMGIAENGAVWCNDKNIPFRAIFFIVKTLVVVIKKENILNNMQEAYENIDINLSNFGVFISGPSKTADIEQSLVIGAHGAVEHFVFLV